MGLIKLNLRECIKSQGKIGERHENTIDIYIFCYSIISSSSL